MGRKCLRRLLTWRSRLSTSTRYTNDRRSLRGRRRGLPPHRRLHLRLRPPFLLSLPFSPPSYLTSPAFPAATSLPIPSLSYVATPAVSTARAPHQSFLLTTLPPLPPSLPVCPLRPLSLPPILPLSTPASSPPPFPSPAPSTSDRTHAPPSSPNRISPPSHLRNAAPSSISQHSPVLIPTAPSSLLRFFRRRESISPFARLSTSFEKRCRTSIRSSLRRRGSSRRSRTRRRLRRCLAGQS
jgi:hypothetical protein